jgi:hypothetical protein
VQQMREIAMTLNYLRFCPLISLKRSPAAVGREGKGASGPCLGRRDSDTENTFLFRGLPRAPAWPVEEECRSIY